MCCGFKNITNTIASLMHMTEKLVSCFAVASVITCFVLTTICMIALGIGIGYNYCIGETKAGHTYTARVAKSARMYDRERFLQTTPMFNMMKHMHRQPSEPTFEPKLTETITTPSTEVTRTMQENETTIQENEATTQENLLQNKTKSLKLFWHDLTAPNDSGRRSGITIENIGPAIGF